MEDSNHPVINTNILIETKEVVNIHYKCRFLYQTVTLFYIIIVNNVGEEIKIKDVIL